MTLSCKEPIHDALVSNLKTDDIGNQPFVYGTFENKIKNPENVIIAVSSASYVTLPKS